MNSKRKYKNTLSYGGVALKYSAAINENKEAGTAEYVYSGRVTHEDFEDTVIEINVSALLDTGKVDVSDVFSVPHKVMDKVELHYTLSGKLNKKKFEINGKKSGKRTSIIGIHSIADEIVDVEFFKPKKEINIIFNKVVKKSILRLFDHLKIDVPEPAVLPTSQIKSATSVVTNSLKKKSVKKEFNIVSEDDHSKKEIDNTRENRSKGI